MKHCPNDQCSYLGVTGQPAEYTDEVATCTDCGAALAPGGREARQDRAPRAASGLSIIARFRNEANAQLARSKLAAAGIDARVWDAYTIAVNWLYADALGGVKVVVAREDAAEALEVLRDQVAGEVTGEMIPETPPDRMCPRCGSVNVRFQSFARRLTFLSIVLLGFPLWIGRNRYVCRSCGQQWKEFRLRAAER